MGGIGPKTEGNDFKTGRIHPEIEGNDLKMPRIHSKMGGLAPKWAEFALKWGK